MHAVVDPVPAAILVPAQFPLVALAPLVPAGVPPLVELVVSDAPVNVSAGTVPGVPVKAGAELVPAGVPALTAAVVFWSPVKVGAATVPAGVMVFDPPLVPTSPFAAIVPMTVKPFSAVTSE